MKMETGVVCLEPKWLRKTKNLEEIMDIANLNFKTIIWAYSGQLARD